MQCGCPLCRHSEENEDGTCSVGGSVHKAWETPLCLVWGMRSRKFGRVTSSILLLSEKVVDLFSSLMQAAEFYLGISASNSGIERWDSRLILGQLVLNKTSRKSKLFIVKLL